MENRRISLYASNTCDTTTNTINFIDPVDNTTNCKKVSTNDYTDADKAAVSTIKNKVNKSDVYTKTELNGIIEEKIRDSLQDVIPATEEILDRLDETYENAVQANELARQIADEAGETLQQIHDLIEYDVPHIIMEKHDYDNLQDKDDNILYLIYEDDII